MKNLTRKDFLKNSLLAGTAAMLSSGRTASAAIVAGGSPNGDIRVGVVGFNGKGRSHINRFRQIPGVKVVALCDVDRTVLAKEAQEFSLRGEKVATYVDFRKLLEDDSIDAVVIATPNHWHALMSIWACQASKDVYLEKPISHNVWEGRKAVEAAAKYKRIVQAGTQSRSDEALREAFAYLQAGNLGKILWARGLCYKLRENIGKTSGPQPVPPDIDYDLWSGPAPLLPPRRNSPNRGSVHYDWHWFWNYGGGDIANQGIHEMDMCRWALGEAGLPPEVMSFGGRFACDDDAETPNTQIAVLGYQAAPLIFEVRGLPRSPREKAMDAYRGIRVGLTVQCENGYFAGGAGGGGVYDGRGKKIKQYSGPDGDAHQANFIAAMRSRKTSDLAAPVEGGHVSSALCHIANISYRLGREDKNATIQEPLRAHEPTKDSYARMIEHLQANGVNTQDVPTVIGPCLQLDPGSESFVTSEKFDLGFWANRLLRREYRKPFVVPEIV
ncbi:MAG: Gfo/Idh/MocA family oxidoreductase [Opitutaceae bacterium]